MHQTDDGEEKKSLSSGMLCPFVMDPSPDCHCLDINNRKIYLAIRFCSQNYEHCRIYQRILKEKGKRKRGPRKK